MSFTYQSMHSMAWTAANTNTNTFSLFSNISQQQQQKSHSSVNVVNTTSSDEELQFDEDEDDEDMVVDLSSGSLEPQPLRGWNLLSDITQKMKKL